MVYSRILTVLLLFFAVFSLSSCSHSLTGRALRSDFMWSIETGPVNAGRYRSVAVADLNNDGYQDIAAGLFLPGGVTIWMGDGQGKWRLSESPLVSGDVRSIATGDLNGDGRLDLVIGGQRDLKGVVVLLQNPDGSWSKGVPPVEKGSYESVKCVDINSDGNLDVVAANSSGDLDGGIQVWLGNGKGGWIRQAGPDAAHIYRDVDIADVNGDGALDIVAASWGHPGGIHVFLGSGDGAWSAFPSPAKEGDFWGVAVADLNGDGKMDIAATTYYQGIKLWNGNGEGKWHETSSPMKKGFYWDILASDFNHDGRIDIAASSVNSKGVRVWLGSRGGWLSMKEGLPDSGGFYGLAVSDVNGDGKTDLTAASYSEGVHVWLGGDGEKRIVSEVRPMPVDMVEKAEPFLAVTRYGIPFEPDGETLSKSAQGVMAELIMRLKESSYESIRIEGHAGSGETPEEGKSLMALSEARAEKMSRILSGKLRIEPGEITVTGFADSKPMEESMKEMGVKNHRVDIIVAHYRSVDDSLMPGEEERKRQEEFIRSQSMSEYKLGPGDILKVIFWKQFSADEYDVLIRPDGTLSFSMVDDLPVSGLTITGLDHLLTKELSRYIKNPRVDILVKEYHSQEVLLMGAINSLIRQPTGPGVYVLKKPTKIVELVTIAGGPRPSANLKKVAVTRKNGTTLYVNLYKAIFQSDMSQDIQIYPGDSIFIPETSEGVSKIYVFGEVGNPGVYDLKEGMSVLEAMGKAGGYTEDAVIKSTQLIRGDLSKPEVISVNVKRFFRTGDLSSNLVLQNNDIIYVPKTRIASASHFLTQFKPVLDLILFPYQFEALRTTIDLNNENVRPLNP